MVDPAFAEYATHIARNQNFILLHSTLKKKMKLTLKKKEDPLKLFMKEIKDAAEEREFNHMQRHNESLKAKRELTNVFSDKMDALISLFKKDNK
jgi:hypothetical protein